MMRFMWVSIIGCFLLGCDPARVFEDNIDVPNDVWVQGQIFDFDFDIKDSSVSYDLLTNIRNAQHYPFRNLYYQYQLMDTAGTILKKELVNIDLYEPKTGKPLGKGLGDLFDHQQLILDKYQFPMPGKYRVEYQQYMRVDSLPLILGVGTRVQLHQSAD